jgi:outer membrane PBP1 activator LpoA protein
LRIKRNNVLEILKGSMGKRVVEALVKLWREKGHLGVITS